SQLRLQEVVQFLGEVRDVATLLTQGRIFVLSSITEGVSLTLLEAMARGLPVVATAVGGNPEVVCANETGFLVPPRNPESLAEALSALWTRPDLCARMGAAGRRRVESLFDVRRMVAAYESTYALL